MSNHAFQFPYSNHEILRSGGLSEAADYGNVPGISGHQQVMVQSS